MTTPLDDILDEYMLEGPSRDTLQIWVKRYPEYERALINFTLAYIESDELAPAEEPAFDPAKVDAIADRVFADVQRRLAFRDQAQAAAERSDTVQPLVLPVVPGHAASRDIRWLWQRAGEWTREQLAGLRMPAREWATAMQGAAGASVKTGGVGASIKTVLWGLFVVLLGFVALLTDQGFHVVTTTVLTLAQYWFGIHMARVWVARGAREEDANIHPAGRSGMVIGAVWATWSSFFGADTSAMATMIGYAVIFAGQAAGDLARRGFTGWRAFFTESALGPTGLLLIALCAADVSMLAQPRGWLEHVSDLVVLAALARLAFMRYTAPTPTADSEIGR